MPYRAQLGDHRRRLRAGVLVVAFALSLFAGRLLQVQGFDGPTYAQLAVAQRLQTHTLPAARGAIVDRNGVALATTVDAVDVIADPMLIEDPEASAAALAPVLGIKQNELEERLARADTRYSVLARQLSRDTWRAVTDLTPRVPGLYAEPTSKRVYPGGELAGNVIGFVNAAGDGGGGIESAQNAALSGADGSISYERDGGGRRIPTGTDEEVEPIAGQDVVLTLDRDIQWVAQRAIAEKVNATGSVYGTVVVQDVRSGEILALATAPTFDPATAGKAPEEIRGNRPLTDVFEPGSTGKLLTAAAAIDSGAMAIDTPVTVPSSLRRAGESFKDFNSHGELNLTFAGVLAKSSNMGTILAAEKTGFETLYRYMEAFGIGQPTDVGLPESRGLLPAPSEWSATTPYTMAFGQGYSITALQGASIFATIANDGVRVQPTIVKGYRTDDGAVEAEPAPATKRVVSSAAAATVRTMLEAVTGEGGTAPAARIPGYRVAGKTGTANRVDPSCGCYRGYTLSFSGFAPADAPQLVVSVVLQDPQHGSGGGSEAGPVFKEVMSFALSARKIPPTGSPPPDVRITTD